MEVQHCRFVCAVRSIGMNIVFVNATRHSVYEAFVNLQEYHMLFVCLVIFQKVSAIVTCTCTCTLALDLAYLNSCEVLGRFSQVSAPRRKHKTLSCVFEVETGDRFEKGTLK